MLVYDLLLIVACLACAVLGTAMLARDTAHAANRLAASLVFGAAFWAICELLWTRAEDAQTALRLVKLSALGWVAIGPLGLHLLLEATNEPMTRVRRLLPWLYGASGVFLVIDWATPLIHTRIVPTAWGWGYELGPFYLTFYLFTVTSLIGALVVGYRAYRRSLSAAERSQARLMAVGILIPLCVASLTDGILPLLGIQVPHLGTASFTVLSGTVTWSLYRYGYALLAPGTFASEIFQAVPEGIALLHLDGRIRIANRGLARLTGCSERDLVGSDAREIWRGEVVDPIRERAQLECELQPRSGETFPVAVSVSLLRDRLGYETGLVIVTRDLREVVALRDRVLLSNRMAAVGQLAAGVAHEINNPMAYVRANLMGLRKQWDALLEEGEGSAGEPERVARLAEGREMIAESLEGVERAIAIVQGIKGFSHAGTPDRKEVDLRALLDSVLRVVQPQLRGRVRVERQDRELPRVRCAAREIQQVLINLVLNASDAIGRSGTLRISSEHDDRWSRLALEDDGCGIAPEHLERIFDPFFTTKSIGEGTGLGLALSYDIVRRHEGELSVVSAPGRGSRFTLSLPHRREEGGPREGAASCGEPLDSAPDSD